MQWLHPAEVSNEASPGSPQRGYGGFRMFAVRGKGVEIVTENDYQLNAHGVGKCKPFECACRLMVLANRFDAVFEGGAGQEFP